MLCDAVNGLEVPPPLEGGGWCGGEKKKRDYKRTIDHVAAGLSPAALAGGPTEARPSVVLLWRRGSCVPVRAVPPKSIFHAIF